MKTFLRKLFFWDEPAQGAFFGMTLLPVMVWFAFSLFCSIMVIDYSLLFRFSLIASLIFAALGILAYILVLEFRMQILFRKKIDFTWKRIWIPLVLFALSLGYGSVVSFMDEMHWKGIMCGTLVLGCFLWNYNFFAVSWKNCVGMLAWIVAFIVFWTSFAFAYEPFRSGTLHELSMTSWIREVIPFGDKLYQCFRLSTATGSFCFLLLGFLFVVAGYFAFGSLFAGYAGLPLFKLFNRKIGCIWGVVAGSYIVFLVLALWETGAYHRAIKDLETHFGHPLTSAELERQFYDGRPANPSFWEEMETAFKAYYDSWDENERDFSYSPDVVFPENIYACHKKAFLENAPRIKLEQMLTAHIPPPKRNYAADQLLCAISTPELSMIRRFARLEWQRILFALEDGDFDVASKALYKMDACREFTWKDHFYFSYLVGIAVETFRLQALEKILATGLAPDGWLMEQTKKLADVEHLAEQLEWHFLFGESVNMLNIFHWLARYAGSEPDSLHKGLHFHSLRFFFPQGWWLSAHESKGMSKVLRVRHFSELPIQRTGYVLVDMLLPSLSKGSEKKRSLIAACSVLRGLIEAEQIKRRTGKYPDGIEGLPQDPFSGLPLIYRKGTCQIVEEVFQETEKAVNIDERDDVSKVPSFERKKRERVLNAVQIWSVGPDSKDNGGIPSTDDIKFIIPIH